MSNTGTGWQPRDIFNKTFATGLFTGYLPYAPGTWGSLLACVILWFVWPAQWYFQILIILVFYPFAVYFSDKAIAYFGPDGRPIVIDEVIGQMAALFMAPRDMLVYVMAFLLFRAFDIIKPPPARGWEKLRGGYGIVADDMAAGVYAAIVLQLIIIVLAKWGVDFQ
jgi:phosphatidylglycerophosphatase A